MQNLENVYSQEFYFGQQDGSALAAAQVVPVLYDIFQPRSVLDVGCGVGYWLKAFLDSGVEDAYGIDGPWVSKDLFKLPPEKLIYYDFSNRSTPFDLALPLQKFDMVITFEFLEHISGVKAQALVDFLCARSDIVVCGAALPKQGGTHHVNEQWPDYWAEMFAKNGYVSYDFLRPIIWRSVGKCYWYAQNTIVYVKGALPDTVQQRMFQHLVESWRVPGAWVHKELFLTRFDCKSYGKYELLSLWFVAIPKTLIVRAVNKISKIVHNLSK